MFNCSASVCSSATDFCFNSAISTGGAPGGQARPKVGLVGWVVRVQDRARLDLYVVALRRRRLQDVVVRGFACQTRKRRKLESERRCVKRVDPERSHRPFQPVNQASCILLPPWARTIFPPIRTTIPSLDPMNDSD